MISRLLQNTRGTVGQEYIAAVAAIALAGVGGFSVLGGSMRESIGGDASGERPAAPAIAAQAAEGDDAPAPTGAQAAAFNARDPYGFHAMGEEELQRSYDEMTQAADQIVQQLGGDPYQLEQAIMQEYGNVDPNTIPQEEQQQLAAAMEAIDLYAAIDGQLAEAYPELLHKKFDGQYSAQGATSEQEVVAFLFRDIANTEQQLQEKISAWEQANGRPCLDQNTQQFDEGCAQDGAVSMLLMSYDALNTDLERRMFELGLDMDDQGQITQLTDDQGNPIRRYYQGSWSLNGFVMGPDGNPLMDSEGRPLVFEPGVDPEMAINGEVDPIGAYDAEIQDIVDAASAEGKDTGPLGWLGNIGIGALKEVRDMVTGLGVGLWRVGFEFLIKDVGGDILGLGCKLISFGQACKGSSWVPLHNTVESTVNFGKKLLPTAWAGVKDLFGNGWSCISGSGARGDNRAQMCGRTVLSIASLFVPATKAGTAGKLGAAVSKAAEGTRFAGVVAKGGELASTIGSKIPGRGAFGRGASEGATVMDDATAAAIREQGARIFAEQGEAAANAFYKDAFAAGAKKGPGVPYVGTPGEGSLLSRFKNWRAWKKDVNAELGHHPYLWKSVFEAPEYMVNNAANGFATRWANRAHYAAGLPYRGVKSTFGYFLKEKPQFWSRRAAITGGRYPTRFGRWMWRNDEYTFPAMFGGQVYNDGNNITENIDAQFGMGAGAAPAGN